jgi:quinol monooxygenase YgiN
MFGNLARRVATTARAPLCRPFSSGDQLLCVHVFVDVKPGLQDDFKAASLENARNSIKEEGIARFDVVQQTNDATKFVLVEVYKNADAPALHKETEHYNTWRENGN